MVDQAQLGPNLQLGSQRFLLGALDSAGNSVLTFNQPLVITMRPTDADVAAANGDLSALAIMVLNADTGAFEALPTTVNTDGTLSASLDHLAQPLPATTAATDARRSAVRRARLSNRARLSRTCRRWSATPCQPARTR